MPAFSVADQDGNIVTNESLMGRKSVIYFYPKDSTPGCTAEACNIRDNYQTFLAKGYTVIGVSKDSQKSHQNFIATYELPFPLLSDVTTEMLQAFGAGGEKKMCGKTCVGTLRKTFVFDENGKKTVDIEFDLSSLRPGLYHPVYTFYNKMENGENYDADSVAGLSFVIETDGTESIEWDAQHWGYVEMPAPRLLK